MIFVIFSLIFKPKVLDTNCTSSQLLLITPRGDKSVSSCNLTLDSRDLVNTKITFIYLDTLE